jgi:predicted  nucleic acid-binding Zn-ribbon protein
MVLTVARRIAVLLPLALLLVACGRSDAVDSATRTSSAARDTAAEALARVAELEAEVSQLQILSDRAESAAEKLSKQLSAAAAEDRQADKVRFAALKEALGNVKSSLRETSDAAEAAGRRAENAALASDSLERAIAVLKERLDYHLKHSRR